MMQDTDDYYMGEALREAQKAFDSGEVPVGAVIVHNNRIIGRAHNQIEVLKDATAHAEMIALTQAASAIGDWRLAEAVIYVTKEPCPMCAGALVNSRIKRLVFGIADKEMGAAGGIINIVSDQRLRHQVEVTGAIRDIECRELLQAFFVKLRGRVAESG